MSLDNKELVRFITEEGMNKGNVGFVRELFSPEYVVHAPGLPFSHGPEAFTIAVGLWRSAFPDFHMAIEDLLVDGDKVVVQFTTTGTHQGLLMGFAPTGKSFSVSGADVHRVVNGKVAESWISDDVPRILLQIGLLADPLEPATDDGP